MFSKDQRKRRWEKRERAKAKHDAELVHARLTKFKAKLDRRERRLLKEAHKGDAPASGRVGHLRSARSKGGPLMSTPLFPDVRVNLVGEDGNAFSILGRCVRAMRRAGVPKEKSDEFVREAQSGDYDNLLSTCVKWFSCDEEDSDEEE